MPGIYRTDEWSVGEAQLDGQPLIVRSRSMLPSLPDRAIYKHLIVISWQYSANEFGMPLPGDNERTVQFEAAVEVALERRGVGVQAACITGQGMKEWRYYTYDPEEFMTNLNQALAGHSVYPIELRMFQDPDWNALSEVLPRR